MFLSASLSCICVLAEPRLKYRASEAHIVVHKSGDIHSSMRKKQFISDHDNTLWNMTEVFERDIIE